MYDAEFVVGVEHGQVRAGVALLNHFNFDFTQNERSPTTDSHNEDNHFDFDFMQSEHSPTPDLHNEDSASSESMSD